MPTEAHDLDRVHSTVRLNKYTLEFHQDELEKAYQAYAHNRKKGLWLRSLIPAAGSHLIFGLGDCLEHPIEHLRVTLPARIFLVVLQIAMFVLVRWDLIHTNERVMLLVAICNGIPTLLLYTLQRSSLHQWDALFLVFGLSFYTIPKITPLGFVTSLIGSWSTAILYAVLSFLVRPPERLVESLLGFIYCAPVIGIFNVISYYSEYNTRERFVLRRRLSRESITLAVARTNPVTRHTSELGQATGTTFFIGVLLWSVFTLGAWASLPETFKFVDAETGWAWFSHCAGLTVFLLIMTRRLLWLFVLPIGSIFVLWMMAMTMPAPWIIVSAHSVGYGLLLASIIVTLGVFSWFVLAWKELVAFLRRTCFLYPQLQAGLEQEYPLLVKIVSEYTAGFDPKLLSSRRSARDVDSRQKVSGGPDATKDTTDRQSTATPPSSRFRRRLSASSVATTASGGSEEDTSAWTEPMVSVLPSFKVGKCFFCSNNDAEHLVPACALWGKWTHWRLDQQFGVVPNIPLTSAQHKTTSPSVAMCTSYYDVQKEKSELAARVEQVEEENEALKHQLVHSQQQKEELEKANGKLRSEMQKMAKRQEMDLGAKEVEHQAKVGQIMHGMNEAERMHKQDIRSALETVEHLRRDLSECETQRQDAMDRLETMETKLSQETMRAEQLAQNLVQLQEQVGQLQAKESSVDRTESIQTLKPKRFPYAQWLEVEGLRESSSETKDFAERWNRTLGSSSD